MLLDADGDGELTLKVQRLSQSTLALGDTISAVTVRLPGTHRRGRSQGDQGRAGRAAAGDHHTF
jgi:hypothetical protein